MFEIRHEGIADTSDSKKAYESIYKKEGIALRDSFYLWLLELFKPEPNKRLLDVSCGEGRLVALAARSGITAIGLDFSFEALMIARQENNLATWSTADGERLPIKADSCDYVTHIGSLEHYEHPGEGAREIARVLKPEGIACILLPNAFGLLGNIRYVLRTGEIFDDGVQPIQRYASRGTWTRLLEENGLRVQHTYGYGEIERPRSAKDARWLALHPKKLIKLALTTLIPLNLKNHLVFICTLA